MKCVYPSAVKLMNCLSSEIQRKVHSHVSCVASRQYSFSVAESTIEGGDAHESISKIQSEFICKIIQNSEIDWKTVESDTLKLRGPLNKRNIYGKILYCCTTYENLDAGKSLLRYLRLNRIPLSLAVILMYFKLCYRCKDQLTESDKRELSNLYEKVVTCYKSLLVGSVAESVVLGVSLTDKWEEGFKFLEIAKESGNPTSAPYAALIDAATSHNKFDPAFRLMEELCSYGRQINSKTLVEFLDKCSKHKNNEAFFKLFLNCLGDSAVIPSRDFADKLAALSLEKILPFEAAQTLITPRGYCQKCTSHLEEIRMTDEMFEELKSHLFSNAIIGSNVFLKTNPKEVRDFLRFIKETAPYDVVIDGLNVGYLVATTDRKASKAALLKKVVQPFLKKNKKILILGRNHMKRWHQRDMDFLSHHCKLFFTENLTHDDPFLLYAALYSDLGTTFVSRDFMRGHKALLPSERLRKTFRLWQQAHQIFPCITQNSVVLKYPKIYCPNIHQLGNGIWHVPYVSAEGTGASNTNHYQDEEVSWLCLTPAVRK